MSNEEELRTYSIRLVVDRVDELVGENVPFERAAVDRDKRFFVDVTLNAPSAEAACKELGFRLAMLLSR